MGDFEKDKEHVFSKPVRAGKRTYFFDVKATRANEFYLTITESKKKFQDDGSFFFEKHKVFLYKEDFEKFMEGLQETLDYIRSNQPDITPRAEENTNHNTGSSSSFSDLDFDSLGS